MTRRHNLKSKLRALVDGIVRSVIAISQETTIQDAAVMIVTTQMKLKLKARVNRSDAGTIRHALEQLAAKGSVRKEGDEFVVEAEMEGASARELNRTFLSALRKVEKRTTLRAEWTC